MMDFQYILLYYRANHYIIMNPEVVIQITWIDGRRRFYTYDPVVILISSRGVQSNSDL